VSCQVESLWPHTLCTALLLTVRCTTKGAEGTLASPTASVSSFPSLCYQVAVMGRRGHLAVNPSQQPLESQCYRAFYACCTFSHGPMVNKNGISADTVRNTKVQTSLDHQGCLASSSRRVKINTLSDNPTEWGGSSVIHPLLAATPCPSSRHPLSGNNMGHGKHNQMLRN
jgi:hypothetical protein